MEVVRTLAVLCLIPLLAHCVSANPGGNVSPPRIALVGDSWPLLMRHHEGFKRALVQEGYRPRQVRNVAVGWSFLPFVEARLSFPGVETYRYLEEPYLRKLDRTLKRYPTIDIIHLSLGGADVLHDMPPNLPPEEQERFIHENVLPNLDALLFHLEQTYPDKHVVFVSYDYINFRDTRNQNKRTQERWDKLGEPDPLEMNRLMLRLTELQGEVARNHPGVTFIDYVGRTKQIVGRPANLAEPTPAAYLWKDGMHLSREGNTWLAEYCLDQAYRQWLMPLRDVRGHVIRPARSPRSFDGVDRLAGTPVSP